MNTTNGEQLQIRVHGDDSKPTLIYSPGIHGDWTLVSSFRERMKPHVHFVEFTYPRTLEWSLDDYANAVLEALEEHNIHEGIVLGESFGSQVAWSLLDKCAEGRHSCRPERDSSPNTDQQNERGDWNAAFPFAPTALILSGGFVRYPCIPLLNFARFFWSIMPAGLIRFNFWAYATFARWRHRHAPETAAAIGEFIERRTPLDLKAIDHRFQLIQQNDPSQIARQVKIPVFQLAGFWDPVVYYPSVRRWLKANCPGYQSTHLIQKADHAVLGTAPEESAAIVKNWI